MQICRGRHTVTLLWKVITSSGSAVQPQVLDALYAAVHPNAAKHYHAFFSSELGGIVTDPALMFIHSDDHMVHRYVISIFAGQSEARPA